jgi:hypothetical protein
VLRFKKNALVCALLDHGQATGLGLNELACKFYTPEHADDWQQLAQLIGYSLSGYGELSYVSDDSYSAAATMADEGLNEKDARIAHLEHELFMVRASLREPIARLYGLHPDDIQGANVMSPTERRVNGICDSRIIWRSRLCCCILKQ